MVNNKKIDLFIIGTQKAGTSSLREYLIQHPELVSHNTNELPYLTFEEEYQKGFDAIWSTYFLPNIKWSSRIVIAKNVLAMYSETALRRLYDHNPEVQIVVFLRNPVNRAYSAYWYARRREEQNTSDPMSAIKNSINSQDLDSLKKFNVAYLEVGKYVKYLRKVYEIFPANQINIFTVEDFKSDTQGVCNDLLKKIGLTPIEIEKDRQVNSAAKPRFPALAKILYSTFSGSRLLAQILPLKFRVWMRRSKIKLARWNDVPFEYPKIDEDLRQWLIDFYTPHNNELGVFLSRDFSLWNR